MTRPRRFKDAVRDRVDADVRRKARSDPRPDGDEDPGPDPRELARKRRLERAEAESADRLEYLVAVIRAELGRPQSLLSVDGKTRDLRFASCFHRLRNFGAVEIAFGLVKYYDQHWDEAAPESVGGAEPSDPSHPSNSAFSFRDGDPEASESRTSLDELLNDPSVSEETRERAAGWARDVLGDDERFTDENEAPRESKESEESKENVGASYDDASADERTRRRLLRAAQLKAVGVSADDPRASADYDPEDPDDVTNPLLLGRAGRVREPGTQLLLGGFRGGRGREQGDGGHDVPGVSRVSARRHHRLWADRPLDRRDVPLDTRRSVAEVTPPEKREAIRARAFVVVFSSSFFRRRLSSSSSKRCNHRVSPKHAYDAPTGAVSHAHLISYDPALASAPLLHRYRTHFVLMYPLFSHTFRKRTRSPEAVNIGTWKLSDTGGLLHGFFSVIVEMSSTSALSCSSVMPWNCFIFQISACSFATYLLLPPVTFTVARAVCFGTGIFTNTPLADASPRRGT